MLHTDLPHFDDKEGEVIPKSMTRVVDAHVHIFPDEIFKSIWSWFDEHAWRIRYRMAAIELLDFLLNRGVNHVVALQYAHKPGIAQLLNTFMAGLVIHFDGAVSGMATVFPGEKNAGKILIDAFKKGLTGVKLHAHVQCFDMNADEMDVIYDTCQSEGKPLVMHVGTEPKSPAYKCDPYELCHVSKLEPVLKNYPKLKICVPHLGFGEIQPYKDLIEQYDTVWLDTAMVLTDYFPVPDRIGLEEYRADRIMYGSDFPNIPYAWDRELKTAVQLSLPDDQLEQFLFKNAEMFFQIKA